MTSDRTDLYVGIACACIALVYALLLIHGQA